MSYIKAFLVLLLITSCVLANLDRQKTTREFKNKGKQQKLIQTNDSNQTFTFKASDSINIDIIKKYKRDKLFFVEGLSFIGKNTLLESTGLESSTEIHHINLDDMSVSNSYTFDGVFGEGSQMIKDQKTGENVVFMMTWQDGQVYKMDEKLTRVIQEFQLPSQMREGWGMAKLDEETILTTDGSNSIFHINPVDFTVKKQVYVFHKDQSPYKRLNEIEVIDGLVYANVWMKNKIIVINPQTGELQDELDFEPLVNSLNSEQEYLEYTRENMDNCLNGIAYNSETKQFLVTGKNWPYIYEIKLNKVQQ